MAISDPGMLPLYVGGSNASNPYTTTVTIDASTGVTTANNITWTGGGNTTGSGVWATGGMTTTTTFGPVTTIGYPYPNTGQGVHHRLTDKQTERLLHDHRFVEMEHTEFCLFCYALDLYRSREDHDFTIREE